MSCCPIFGPSTVRDTVGFVGDQFTDPKFYVNDFYVSVALSGGALLDLRAELLATDEVLARAYDPYVFVRNAYLQRREFQVKDGKPSDDVEIFEDEAAADPGPEPEPAATTPAEQPAPAQ